MSRYVWGLIAGGVLVSCAGLGFALILIATAARERREARQRAAAGQSIFEAAVTRQTNRLRAELDDEQAVAAWLTGGNR